MQLDNLLYNLKKKILLQPNVHKNKFQIRDQSINKNLFQKIRMIAFIFE